MISEEHNPLESSSGPVSSNGFHVAQHVQTTLEPPPVSEPMTNSYSAEVLGQTHQRNLSTTVEEVELTTLLDRTLIEEGNSTEASSNLKKHAKVPSGSSISFPPKGHVSKKSRDSHSTRLDGSVEGGSPISWHPLHSKEGETQGYDNTVLVEDDITDSKGKLLYPQTSIDSPLQGNLKSMEGYYSPSTQQKFHTMPKASGHRPLIPKSSYYFGPPSPDSAYGTAPTGHIGVHHPREILRVERDYTGGELIQFAPIYPLELEGRITPTQFLESINSINELLISAHTLRYSFLDNVVAIFSLQISKLFLTTHFEKEMKRLQHLIDELNVGTFNPVGLNILWPRNVAFLYLEIEYY